MKPIAEVVVGLVILVGLVGIVLPVLPGLALVVAAVLIWSIAEATAIGWVIFAVALLIGAGATVIKYLIPGRRLKEAGVPMSTMLGAAVGAVVGFVVIPIIGAPIGFVGTIYLIELQRQGREAAWPATKRSAGAVALSIGIELAAGLAIFGIWLAAAIFG